jgi:DNA-binding MarR family transcriptional regulator
MTFPAWDTFEEDARIKTWHVKVYRYCRRTLDFREERLAKRDVVADRTGIDKADVTRTLNDLVAWGYLVEHPRDPDGARRFTLAWSRGGNIPPQQQPGETRKAS